ncbi:MAG: tRNA (N(6)-L-threonylcarbamoyladenosine(37)-C(2))-methylthiotransferase MtaB [Culicoidibacterales bacterium]
MATVAFHTLGCKVNTYETEAMWQLFKDQGYTRTDFKSASDVYVINTCTVTNTGDSKSRKAIRQAIRRNPEAIIVVTGCYAQIAPKEIMDIEGVDIVVGTQGREQLMDYVTKYQAERQPINAVTNIMKQKSFETLGVETFTENHRAFLKIQEGCNNFCTYCIIPWARGLMRSRDPKEVIEQSQKLVAAGFKEIVLTGIHTAGYGEELEGYDFADLLNDLDTQVPGLERIRISSIEASQVDGKVIEILKRSNKVVDHLHIPLQGGSDDVLKRMRRNYDTAEFKAKIAELREIFPTLAITTDVIVGFPGETDEEFQETFDLIREVGFRELHVFPYSKRNGTPAAKMPDQVPDLVKTARVAKLIALSEQLAKNYASQFEGETVQIIVEEMDKKNPGYVQGHSGNYLKVRFAGDESLIGQMVDVHLEQAGYPICEGILLD